MNNNAGARNINLGKYAGSEQSFINELIAARLLNLQQTGPNAPASNELAHLENLLASILEFDFYNPTLDNFLIVLIQSLNANAQLEDAGYAEHLLRDYILEKFTRELSRALAFLEPQKYSELIIRYARILSVFESEVQTLYGISSIDVTFLSSIDLIYRNNHNSFSAKVQGLVSHLKANPTFILNSFVNVPADPTFTVFLDNNLYLLVRRALRRFLIENPAGSNEYDEYLALLNNDLPYKDWESEFLELILNLEDKALAWIWIDQFKRGEEISRFDPESEPREIAVTRIFAEYEPMFENELKALLENINVLKKSLKKTTDAIEHLKVILKLKYANTIAIEFQKMGVVMDISEIKRRLIDSLDPELKTQLLVVLDT